MQQRRSQLVLPQTKTLWFLTICFYLVLSALFALIPSRFSGVIGITMEIFCSGLGIFFLHRVKELTNVSVSLLLSWVFYLLYLHITPPDLGVTIVLVVCLIIVGILVNRSTRTWKSIYMNTMLTPGEKIEQVVHNGYRFLLSLVTVKE